MSTFRREYQGSWLASNYTLHVYPERLRTRLDVDKFRGHRPNRIVVHPGSIPVMLSRYLFSDVLGPMLADGAELVEADVPKEPEGIHITIHDVPEGVKVRDMCTGIRALRPASVLVDTACGGNLVLDTLRHYGVRAQALPKGPRP